jgi:hypothetical protein
VTGPATVEGMLAAVRHRHRIPANANIASGWACLARCRGRHPCLPYRMATALKKAVDRHQPEQLYGLVEDWHGKVVCPHGENHDSDLHYEGPDGWYCKALPTVIVCASCCDPDDATLRATWPCDTWTDIARELGIEAPS